MYAHGRELHHDVTAVFVYGLSERVHRWDATFIVDVDDVIEGTDGASGGRYGLGDAERDATLGAFTKIGDLPIREDVLARVAVL